MKDLELAEDDSGGACFRAVVKHNMGLFERPYKLIKDFYNQLKPNGYMIFTTISKEAPMFGKGKQLGKDYFEIMEGVKVFFYDSDSIKQEFGKYGMIEFSEIVSRNGL